jgi:hypothetical protein
MTVMAKMVQRACPVSLSRKGSRMGIVQSCVAAMMAASILTLTAQEPYEAPSKFTATALLGAAAVKGTIAR